MKIFKATRKCVMGALALTLAVSGALALRTFARTDAFAAEDASGIVDYDSIARYNVSDEIKTVMESFVGSGGVTKIEYVKDYAVTNADGTSSGTVTGIRLNLTATMGGYGYPNSSTPRSALTLDAGKLSYGDNLLGFVIDNKAKFKEGDPERMRVIAPYIKNSSGDTAYLWISGGGSEDRADNPVSYAQIRVFDSKGNNAYEGIYTAEKGVVSSAQKRKASLGGYTSTPYNIYYDFGDNALCGDGYTETDSKLIKFLNRPNNEYSSVPVNALVSGEAEYKNSDAPLTYGFKLNDDGKVNLGIRVDAAAKDGAGYGLILTSFAGLDLTNPSAPYPVDVKSGGAAIADDGAKIVKAGKAYAIPTIAIAGDDAKTFSGTVDVYKNSNVSNKGLYAVKKLVEVYKDKSVGDEITVNDLGDYTLIYKGNDGVNYPVPVAVKLFADVKFTGIGAFAYANPDTTESIEKDTVLTLDGDSKFVVMATEGYLDTVVLKNNDVTPAVETVIPVSNGGIFELDFAALSEAGKIGVNNELVATARNYYTVNFVSFGETLKTAEVKQNAAIPFPEVNPSEKGYAFAGWKMGETVLDGSEVLPYAGEDTEMTVTIEARNVLNQYKATLKLPEAYAGVATLNATSGTFTMLSDIDFAAPSVAEGLKFGGWFYNGEKITKGEQLPAEDVELYAYISKDVVTVTFMHGAEVVETAEVLKGKKATASKYSIDGCLLKGWFTDKAGTAAFDFETAVTADTTLYGVFVKLDDNTVTGGDVSAVKSEAKVLDNTNVKAFNLISAKGLVTMIIAIAGLAATVAFAVLIILNLTKKKAVPISEDEAQGGKSADESIEK